MLVIPNTTTVATEQTPGFVSFPPDAGSLTPYTAGFLFVANNSAQISIRKGPNSPGTWTPYALVSPTLVPLSTDRGGRKTPDFIWGVKAIDGVSGTHAQVFGALFQAGEAGFVPSAQFGGTINASGGFTPPVVPRGGQELGYSQRVTTLGITATTELTAQQVVTGPNIVFDGVTIAMITLSCPALIPPAAGLNAIYAILTDNGVSIGQVGLRQAVNAGANNTDPFERSVRITPSAGAHVYEFRSWADTNNGAAVIAGAGGPGTNFPAYIRIVQAV